ncbi:MAG: DUF58 domain-containing protein [Candidatus Acetothermia bacterium]|nr:DUF58 domain-containing protein [Candidatus Acetothermia bacterium]
MGGRKTTAELSLLFLLLLLGLGLRHPGVVLLAVPVAVHLTFGLSLSYAERHPRLRASRTVSANRLLEGDSLRIEVVLENMGLALEAVTVEDGPYPGWEVLDGAETAIGPLPAEGRLVLGYTARPRRGLYPLSSIRVQVRDLLGYVLWEGEVACPAPVAVLPRCERLTGVAIAPRRTLVAAGTARARRGGTGTEFFGAREYLPGDDVRRINWKAYARLGGLVINQFEEERAADVVVVLDVRADAYLVPNAVDLLDHAVRAAGALCQFFLGQGHRVGLLLYGRYLDWVFPGYGRLHGERLLRELARAELGTTEIFSELGHLPTRLLRAGSQVVLVSPLVPGDEEELGRLQARGYRVMVLVPDPLAFEQAQLEEGPEVELSGRILALERWVMWQKLVSAGIRPLVWDVRCPLAPQAKAHWRRAR